MAKKGKIKIRRKWRINPRSRVKDSNKKYKRKKAKSNLKKVVNREVYKDET